MVFRTAGLTRRQLPAAGKLRLVPVGIATTFAGLALATLSGNLAANTDSARVISIYNIHNKETVTVTYKRDGQYVPAAMKKLNWVMRDWRRNEAREMDPKLIDIIWEIHTELGSKEPVRLISGYRSRKTNNGLRRARGGQAKNSRHILGKAADIHFPDVPVRKLRYSALVRERGGVGYYPTSALPFVHVDTGRVRHWPRIGRSELALLTKGRSKHIPRGGRPVTRADYHKAKTGNKRLAQRIALFHAERTSSRGGTAIASLDTAAPRNWVIPQPRVAARPATRQEPVRTAALVPGPDQAAAPVQIAAPKPVVAQAPAGQRKQPATTARPARPVVKAPDTILAALDTAPDPDTVELPAPILPEIPAPPTPARTPRQSVLVASLNPGENLGALQPVREPPSQPFFELSGWATAPVYDDEHDGELAYRPFPIGPFLTENPSIDDPVLARLVHPDLVGTRDLVGRTERDIPLRFKPGLQYAAMLWSDIFTEGDVSDLLAGDPALRASRQRKRVAQQ